MLLITFQRAAALSIDDGCRRACFASGVLAHRDVVCVVNVLQRAVPVPQHEVVGAKVVSQGRYVAPNETAGALFEWTKCARPC